MNTINFTWQRLDLATLPPPRVGGGLTLSPNGRRLILLGGVSPFEGHLSDIWMMNEDRWASIATQTKPDGRTNLSLAYDEVRKEVVLFGGITDNAELSQETWLFNGSIWRKLGAAASPTPRCSANMVYDRARKNIILFGGQTRGEIIPVDLGDTWIWDGGDWQQQFPATSPKPRGRASMVYDPLRQETILFGGLTSDEILDDIWIWDGSNWIQQQPLHIPPGRFGAGIAYDETNQQVVLFGGWGAEGVLNDTWVWDGQDWTQLYPSNSPSEEASRFPNLAFDPVRQTIVLYTTIQIKHDRPEDFQAYSEIWTLS